MQKTFEQMNKDFMLDDVKILWTGQTVMPDGMLRYGPDTFTMEQWNKVIALRNTHALEMKNLKAELAAQNK